MVYLYDASLYMCSLMRPILSYQYTNSMLVCILQILCLFMEENLIIKPSERWTRVNGPSTWNIKFRFSMCVVPIISLHFLSISFHIYYIIYIYVLRFICENSMHEIFARMVSNHTGMRANYEEIRMKRKISNFFRMT